MRVETARWWLTPLASHVKETLVLINEFVSEFTDTGILIEFRPQSGVAWLPTYFIAKLCQRIECAHAGCLQDSIGIGEEKSGEFGEPRPQFAPHFGSVPEDHRDVLKA